MLGKCKLVSLTFLLFLVAIACKKEDSPSSRKVELPYITQTGEHTFGCMIDDRVWRPSPSISSETQFHYLHAYLFLRDGADLISIKARIEREGGNDSNSSEYFDLYAYTDIIGSQRPLLISTSRSGCEYYYDNYKDGPLYSYRSIISDNSWINISRLDTVERIISGTFSAEMLNENDHTDTIRVREGRFDVRILPP
tara:strand:+ start:628 stop:1215 length:588 start_codon:yes stop_codon:yes gene_type:complete